MCVSMACKLGNVDSELPSRVCKEGNTIAYMIPFLVISTSEP